MSAFTELQKSLVNRILEGGGKAPISVRRAAFNNSGLSKPLELLVDKVAMHANTVTDDDIDAAKRSGLSEDHIFEIMVCAAIGQATRQYDAALASLETAIGKD